MKERFKVTHIQKGEMKRNLSIRDIFAIGYGDLGSSIYYALGVTALLSLGATPISLLLAGIVFLCTALTYAELSSVFHDSGGSASFARHVFNDAISFVAGWGLLLDYIVTIAISAFSVGSYLAVFFPSLKTNVDAHILFTIALIVCLYILNYRGAKESAKFSLFLVCLTLFTQVAIIIIGFAFFFDITDIIKQMSSLGTSPTWSSFWKGTAMAMVAYTGIESIAQLSSEIKNPEKNIPKTIVLTMISVFVIYVGLSIVTLSLLTPVEISIDYINDPIAGAVKKATEKFGYGQKILSPWLGIVAAAILTVAANAGLVGASRLSFKMGEFYQLPHFFHKLSKKRKTPFIALAFFTVIASLIVIGAKKRGLEFLADLYNFGAMLAFFSAHMSLIVLRIKQPELERPFKLGLSIRFGKKIRIPLTAIIGALATFSVWVLVVVTKEDGRYLGTLWILGGLAMYYFYRNKKHLPFAGNIEVESIDIEGYKKLEIKKILVATRGGRNTEAIQSACLIANKTAGSVVHALYIDTIAHQLASDAQILDGERAGELALQRAEALVREEDVTYIPELMRARSVQEGILAVLEREQRKQEPFDLLILGACEKSRLLVSEIQKNSSCRVWVCKGATS